MKETAGKIREELKKLGFSLRDVKVYISRGNAIRVYLDSLESVKKLNEIEKIALKYERVDYDERTGEILSGGNTFVFVEISDKMKDKIINVIKKKLPYENVKDFQGDWEENGIFLHKTDNNIINGMFIDTNDGENKRFTIKGYENLCEKLMDVIIKNEPDKLDWFLKDGDSDNKEDLKEEKKKNNKKKKKNKIKKTKIIIIKGVKNE